jgi:membrane-associated protease RseP (regulator of RpoE activity)
METLITIAILLLIVIIHEIGHTTAAIAVGYKVEKVVIGAPLPPTKTFTWKGKQIVVSPWLIGGGVDVDDEHYYGSAFWKKALVAIAGPATNIIAGLITAVVALGPRLGSQIAGEFLNACIRANFMLLEGKIGLSSLSSPVGVVKISGNIMTRADILTGALFIWLLLNFAIATINLLPIPALDGGQLVTGAICALFGNSPKIVKITQKATSAFFSVIFATMVCLVLRDILNLLGY